MTATVATTCPYCGVGCGLRVTPDGHGGATVQGDPDHPANFGRLCSKGAALGETLDLEDRVLFPEIAGQRASWDAALDRVAAAFGGAIAQHGPDSVALYVSGQFLTEDYYVANKLMKGFVGSANIDTNSRLCMASSVAGHKRAFGGDCVPGSYVDLEQAELILLVGSNLAWCHPVLFQRIEAARRRNPELAVISIDPRRTATAAQSDLHLPVASGSDGWLFNGLLVWLADHGALDADFIAAHTSGFAAALAGARAGAGTLDAVARACDVAPDVIETLYRRFAATERVVTIYSQGINQSASGTDKVNAIINCHLATRRIGRPGMGPFSVTGQPNAMGGREVGGLANQLAAHMDLADARQHDLVRRFWQAPNLAAVPGLKAVDLFAALEAGKIRALWVMGTNPAVSLPDGDRVRRALARCDFVAVAECSRLSDTARYADVLLPALAWGEKDGTVTNSERRISRQRRFLAPPGEARADWWMLTQLARRLGFGAAFAYQNASDIFREHAALSGFENAGERAFDISALATLDQAGFDALAPVQWPVDGAHPTGTARLFGDGCFVTPDRRARFVAIVPRPPVNPPNAEFPLVLNTGRVRDHWHTMTRTAKAPTLAIHHAEPTVALHPDAARRYGLAAGDLARVVSAWGSMLARVTIDPGQRPDDVFVPMHWSDAVARAARVDALANPAVDPISGQPELKHTPVRIAPTPMGWHGFAVSRSRLEVTAADYWVAIKRAGGWRCELAGRAAAPDGGALLRAAFGPDADYCEVRDAASGLYRGAALDESGLLGCLFIGAPTQLPPRAWLDALLAAPAAALDPLAVLAGRAASGADDGGRPICACFGVGERRLVQAIVEQGCATPEAIGTKLRAGTNCGSCLPEIRALLAKHVEAVTA